MVDTLSDIDDPADLERTTNHHADTCAITVMLEAIGIDGRSLIIDD